jgi:DNA processing protein
MAGDEDFAAWFRLLETPGVGRESARRLLAACGSPGAVWRSSESTLRGIVGAAVAKALTSEPPEFAGRLDAARRWLDGGADRRALALGDAAYPAALLHTADPPLLLYVQGDAALLSHPRGLAIVGSRQPTPQGADNATAFARELAVQGWLVVSGLALGIDAAAHTGALAAGAPTVAVIGTGPDRVYPARHRALAQRIAATGAVVSEYAPGTPPLPENFPPRNRIIAGITRGMLVVEAALRSGSLITARLASECGREVFAVPGSIHSPQSRGCHALIQQGAKLVESAQDILDELQGTTRPGRVAAGGIETPDSPLLAALGHDPVTLDALMARTGEAAATLSAQLLELELIGQVARLPGGLYQRRKAG